MDESTQALTVIEGSYSLAEYSPIEDAGQAANRAAAAGLFADYRTRQAPNTITRQDRDLYLFARYLADAGITPGSQIAEKADALKVDADAWKGVTWGMVSAFVRWLENKGYAIGSINLRLTSIKVYAGLAKQAGKIEHDEYASMRLIRGYKRTEGKHLDEGRAVTRLGPKKADATPLTREQANALKNSQPNTPQGRRDAVLMCLLLDHGLRVGELAILTRKSLNMSEQVFIVERPKVDLKQTHRFSADTLRHIRAYLKSEKPAGQLLQGSRKGQGPLVEGMSVRAIKARVQFLGLTVGVSQLSPHDCRHAWATFAANAKTDILSLQEAGGWASLAMPRHYVERSRIANEGVRLS